MSTTSKSPRRVLLVAHRVAQRALPTYSHPCSPKTYTQHQLFACLVLMKFFRTDYRGIAEILEDLPDLRREIGMEKVPHFTTFQKAHDRLLRAGPLRRLLDRTVDMAVEARVTKRRAELTAADASGFESQPTSHHFRKRCEKTAKSGPKPRKRRFPKAAVLADCNSHMILSTHTGRGPGPDQPHLERLLIDARWRVGLGTLLADAGYDGEHLHELCRHDLNITSLIPAKIGRPTDKAPAGYFRRLMHFRLHLTRYPQRWQVETVFSMIKRRLGSALHAHGYHRQRRAMNLLALTHNIMILRHDRRVFYRATPGDLLSTIAAHTADDAGFRPRYLLPPNQRFRTALMTDDPNANLPTNDIDEYDTEEWEDDDSEADDLPQPHYNSVEEKYTSTQLQVVRSTMDLSLHNLRTSLKDSNYIRLAPGYQRRARWNRRKKSQLIESFLMNIPVPPIFLFENQYNQYEVMDGRQRLESVWDFLGNRFRLSGLEFWKELDGCQYDDLQPTLQRGLLRRTITAIVLLAETQHRTVNNVDVRMVLFRRLNTGGVKLNPQELRNALYPGLFNELLRHLARHDIFTKLWGIPPHTPGEDESPNQQLLKNHLYNTMTDCELVLRFFAVREIFTEQRRGSLKRLLDETMRYHSNDSPDQIAESRELFISTLDRIDQALPGNPFELPTTNRLSRPLYDALMVAGSLHPEVDFASQDAHISRRLIEALEDEESYDTLTGKGNTIDAIKDRVRLAEHILIAE